MTSFPHRAQQTIAPLQATLSAQLHDAQLKLTPLPGTPLQLWLLDPAPMRRAFTDEEVQRIQQEPLYWCFCWASGLVMAQWLLNHPERVQGKTVLDFGAGSGVVAIAAAYAGAAKVVACDIDPLARQACLANAAANGISLEITERFAIPATPYDWILAADVLYERSNLRWLSTFSEAASQVLVADSRVRDFHHPHYQRIAQHEATTCPDLDESPQFRHVSLYHALSCNKHRGASATAGTIEAPLE
ncbi:methyltransferase [Lampropedia puyangensis]|uniref:Methyltransferase n=1 Tax=Lampropedia puyangensis TaxID=1330072 RepID=A0A4S8EX02_9BURK|nr:50S ribosomal protein L11 methyltransferase [Lampropedia puyangensis]THT99342.1 methyltransferase [Lampropedia puyangensis]